MKQKIGILCPSDSEAAPFLADMEGVTETRKAMLRFYEGTFHGVDVVTLFSGVCKVNAALATQILIDSYQAGAVLNVGTGGALAPGLSGFDTVVAPEAGYHDVSPEILTEFHPWLPAPVFPSDAMLLALARQAAARGEHPVVFGRMVTGETFLADEGRREAIRAAWHPLSVDMETAAVAHVCYVNQVPFLAVRTLTDTADQRGAACFEQNCDKAAWIAKEVTRTLLETWRCQGL